MPQLDFSTYASQAFWMIFFFCLLWCMLAIFVTPKIADIQEQRKRKIHEYVRKAEELNLKAQDSINRYERELEKAKSNQRAAMEKLHKELAEYVAQAEAQSAAKLNQQIAASELLLAKEKQETSQKIGEISQEMAVTIIKKLGLHNISEKEIAKIAMEKNND